MNGAEWKPAAALPVYPPGQAAARPGLDDLHDRRDVDFLVRTFYAHAFQDPLLGPIFLDIARVDLEAHLPVMCDFWETVLFRAGLYRRNVLGVHLELHAKAELTPQHFARWLHLWMQTVDDHFAGRKADFAKIQAARIASSMSRRLLSESSSKHISAFRS